MSVSYLQGLEDRYDRWIAAYEDSDILVIDTDSIDIHDRAQRDSLLDLIETRIHGPSAEPAHRRLSAVPAR